MPIVTTVRYQGILSLCERRLSGCFNDCIKMSIYSRVNNVSPLPKMESLLSRISYFYQIVHTSDLGNLVVICTDGALCSSCPHHPEKDGSNQIFQHTSAL